MNGPVFLNGPVQNGSFDFQGRPGKAVGIRIAATLNDILGHRPVPHLWNTVTLAGDLRHRRMAAAATTRRRDLEADLIAAKYLPSAPPVGGVVTDADAEVAQLALAMIEEQLRRGDLRLSRETVRTCRECGHLTGAGGHACRACGSLRIGAKSALHLVAEAGDSRAVLDRSNIHAAHRRQPLHLQRTAPIGAPRLILSRTRQYGIELSPLGLDGLVLDPRAGLHVAVLSVARALQADVAVMTTTQNAARNIAAYGQYFRAHQGTRLQYALHGHAPYDDVAGTLSQVYPAYRADAGTRSAFERWFLPLMTLKEKTAIPAPQLVALFRYFARTLMSLPAHCDEAVLQELRQAVVAGDPSWVTSRVKLAHAVLLADPVHPDD
ncbi:hypothetical protein [Kribbella solani]|uniref:RNA polymerase subunit RPABC4/transcription elongation factor Spt4 n=1 Tax=Kribbella solani TaxID=236067 RepID=A0A841DV54_9ACTN|nr:hypothetical protein [Kribbella solani]MBB5980157.1 RNA polymerase subunit RPABC4/transcription elongation factor Spt4 [Kribbella solani]